MSIMTPRENDSVPRCTPVGAPTVISETSEGGVWKIEGQKRFMYHWHNYTQTVSRYAKNAAGRIAAEGMFWRVETQLDLKDSPPRPPMLDHFTTLPEELDGALAQGIMGASL